MKRRAFLGLLALGVPAAALGLSTAPRIVTEVTGRAGEFVAGPVFEYRDVDAIQRSYDGGRTWRYELWLLPDGDRRAPAVAADAGPGLRPGRRSLADRIRVHRLEPGRGLLDLGGVSRRSGH